MTGPLRLRDFRLLFSARAISYVGTYLAPIAVAFAILDNGGGATAVGLGFAAWTLAQVAMLVVGGVVGDRISRRVVMIGSDVASTAVRTTMGVLLLSGHAEIWQLIALQACGGAAVAFYSPASYGLIREVVPRGDAAAGQRVARHRPLRGVPARRRDRRGDRRPDRPGDGAARRRSHLRDERAAPLADPGRLDCARRCRIRPRAPGGLERLRRANVGLGAHRLCLALFPAPYAPFFVLGPYVAKHSMDGARSWAFVVTGEGVGALLGGLTGIRWRPGGNRWSPPACS